MIKKFLLKIIPIMIVFLIIINSTSAINFLSDKKVNNNTLQSLDVSYENRKTVDSKIMNIINMINE
jgi:hypothetical protein